MNNSDSDGDGIYDGDEVNDCGTDPLDSESCFILYDLEKTQSGNVVRWDAVSNRFYTVYWSTNLLNGFSPSVEGQDLEYPVNSYTDSVHSAESQIFYKLSVNSESCTESTFQIISGSFTWDEAKSDAEARGGHLATFTSQEEWDEMLMQIGTTIDEDNWWLGATDEETEGLWKWVTGELWEFTCWYPGEPNNYNDEDYLVTWVSNSEWNDADVDATNGYILEVD